MNTYHASSDIVAVIRMLERIPVLILMGIFILGSILLREL